MTGPVYGPKWARVRVGRDEPVDWRRGLAEVLRASWNVGPPLAVDMTTDLAAVDSRMRRARV